MRRRSRGMAPGAKLAFFDMGSSTTGLFSTPSNLANMFKVAHQGAGARIHSNSWGTITDAYLQDDKSIDE